MTNSDSEELAFLAELNKRPERKRKPTVPDTDHLKAPKVIPGGAVVYISRLPHGFFESELRSYLSQFGSVTRLRLSRNPRTGSSRHYAFVEFRHSEVAKIVVDTMNNYLLMGHLLQCKMVPEEKIHPELWKGANRKFVKIPWRRINIRKHNSMVVDEESMRENAKRLIERKKEQFKDTQLDYDFDNVLTGDLC